MNADALSRNLVGLAIEDEDFGEEIRDITDAHPDAPEEGSKLLCAMAGKETEWMGVRRKDRRRQQLELVLAAQELSEFGDPKLNPTELDEEEDQGVKHNCADIW
ncbi:unnamed protein product [Sphagnum balticum]